ncbi:MAG: glycosyltransferase [Flavobacteriales bacterium]|nr:glycosyltransferase [Flavobacteriales bacterium]
MIAIPFIVICAAWIISVVWVLMRQKRKPRKEVEGIHKLSVVICYRDEVLNIGPLLRSIQSQALVLSDVEFIFVDDHSSDGTSQLIESMNIPNSIVLLNHGQGKKMALQTGVQKAKHTHVLLLDADVEIPDTHFSRLMKNINPAASMTVLPVIPIGNRSFFQIFQVIEFGFMEMVNRAFSKTGNPILCNGAQLCVKRTNWLESFVDIQPEIPSGDDMFLLQAMINRQELIDHITNPNLGVKFKVCESWGGLIAQRIRWGSKAKSYNDQRITRIGWWVLLAQLSWLMVYYFGLVYCLEFTSKENDNLISFSIIAIIFWLYKVLTGSEIRKGIVKAYSVNIPEKRALLFPVLFPFYFLLIANLTLFSSTKWKGRKI